MAGAGGLIALLLQIPTSDRIGQGLVIVVVGTLMIVYVLVGGMKGTTWVQIIKAVLLLVGAARDDRVGARAKFGFNLSATARAAPPNAARTGDGELLEPGLQYGRRPKLDFISLALALVLGTAGLPHVLMRFYTVPNAVRGAPLGGLGDLADRRVLPVHAGARVRRDGAAAAAGRSTRRRTRTPPRRCWPTSSAASCCSASSRRSRSPRSSRSSPG